MELVSYYNHASYQMRLDATTQLINGQSWRVVAALVPGLVVVMYILLQNGPMPQPISYHQFADTRVLMGIPNVGDVLTNLAFILVGALGLWSLRHLTVSTNTFVDNREQILFQWLFTGVLLTGFGSGWYHLEPDNYSLVWDRLPMTIAFMSIFLIMISERINLSLGFYLLVPLLITGIASVIIWIWSEHIGHGDLRFYLFVQFYPMLTIALMLIFLPSRYTHGNFYWGLFVFYAAAKVLEIYDQEIYHFTQGLISGHSLKHLSAAMGAAWLLIMLWLRQPYMMTTSV